MANETTITVIGNLTDDPEMRFTDSGRQVASFTIASTPRYREGEKWVDRNTLFMRCNLWGPPAENMVASLKRGHRVIAQGNLIQRDWVDREGGKRVSIELNVTEIGASVQFATLTVTKATKGDGSREQAPLQDPRDRQPANQSAGRRSDDDWD